MTTIITNAAALVPALSFSKKKSGKPTIRATAKQIICRFVMLKATFVLIFDKSFGTGTYAIPKTSFPGVLWLQVPIMAIKAKVSLCPLPVPTREEFVSYKNKYTKQAEQLQKANRDLQEKIRDVMENRSERNRWIRHFTKFVTLDTLDRKAVVQLIQTITVYGKDELAIRFNYTS